jgi:hypothetical protein
MNNPAINAPWPGELKDHRVGKMAIAAFGA